MLPYILTICAVACIACGQLLFKMTANRMAGRAVSEWAMDLHVLIPFFISMVIYAGATLLWILALRDLPLSRAYMFMTLSFVIVPALSAVFFEERLTIGFLIGLGLILVGLFVTQRFS
ncbi:MAG: EamA family transporter [Pseudomonadota bacterium]